MLELFFCAIDFTSTGSSGSVAFELGDTLGTVLILVGIPEASAPSAMAWQDFYTPRS